MNDHDLPDLPSNFLEYLYSLNVALPIGEVFEGYVSIQDELRELFVQVFQSHHNLKSLVDFDVLYDSFLSYTGANIISDVSYDRRELNNLVQGFFEVLKKQEETFESSEDISTKPLGQKEGNEKKQKAIRKMLKEFVGHADQKTILLQIFSEIRSCRELKNSDHVLFLKKLESFLKTHSESFLECLTEAERKTLIQYFLDNLVRSLDYPLYLSENMNDMVFPNVIGEQKEFAIAMRIALQDKDLMYSLGKEEDLWETYVRDEFVFMGMAYFDNAVKVHNLLKSFVDILNKVVPEFNDYMEEFQEKVNFSTIQIWKGMEIFFSQFEIDVISEMVNLGKGKAKYERKIWEFYRANHPFHPE